MAEEMIPITVFVIVAIAVLWLIKIAHDLKTAIVKRSGELDARLMSAEQKAISSRKDVEDMHRIMNDKVDGEEMERRINGLVELVTKKEKKHVR